jgi:hypothetical protein
MVIKEISSQHQILELYIINLSNSERHYKVICYTACLTIHWKVYS